MAVAFTELHDNGGAEGQSTAFGVVAIRASRRFLVPGYDPVAVLSHVSLPTFGTAHPSQPGLIALGPSSVERRGSGTDSAWVVEIPYAISRIGGGPIDPPDVTSPLYKAYNLTSSKGEKTLPYFAGHKVLVPDPFTLTAGVGYQWERIDFTVPTRIMHLRIRINIDKMSFGLPKINAIRGEQNKIHVFGGLSWLFEGADIDEQEEGIYHVIYRWTAEEPLSPQAHTDDDDTSYVNPPTIAAFESWTIRFVQVAIAGTTRTQLKPIIEANGSPYATGDISNLPVPGGVSLP